MDAERVEYLKRRFHSFDPQAIDASEIPKPDGMLQPEAERMGRMIAAAMKGKERGKGKGP